MLCSKFVSLSVMSPLPASVRYQVDVQVVGLDGDRSEADGPVSEQCRQRKDTGPSAKPPDPASHPIFAWIAHSGTSGRRSSPGHPDLVTMY